MAERVRVLLVDDHELVRLGTRKVLEFFEDIEVVGEAQDGQEAIDQVEKLKPDVVLMDISMQGMNGLEATRRIKKAMPGTGVLALSTYDDDQFVFAALEAGAAGYLLKNVRAPKLVDAILAVKNGEPVIAPELQAKVVRRVAERAYLKIAPSREHLTARELEVLREAARGLANKEIAARLDISTRTVQVHLANIFQKLEVGSRTEAVLYALRSGLIRLEETEDER